MELKAIKEYKSPEYPTTEESKNRILMMMVRTGKISLGVAVMCLLCNCSFANNQIFVGYAPVDVDIGGIVPISPPIHMFVEVISMLGISICLLLTIFFTKKSHKKYENCEEILEKEKLCKKRNKIFIKGVIFIIIFILLFLFSDIIAETLLTLCC